MGSHFALFGACVSGGGCVFVCMWRRATRGERCGVHVVTRNVAGLEKRGVIAMYEHTAYLNYVKSIFVNESYLR